MSENQEGKVEFTDEEVEEFMKKISFDCGSKVANLISLIDGANVDKEAKDDYTRLALDIFPRLISRLEKNITELELNLNRAGVEELLEIERKILQALQHCNISRENINSVVDNYGEGNDEDISSKLEAAMNLTKDFQITSLFQRYDEMVGNERVAQEGYKS